MTSVRVIPHSTFTAMPWPNGAGTSWQISSDPAGSNAPDCSWQFSTALIERSAPFSLMPGIDRVLTLIDGDGFQLDIDGLAPIDISQRFVPVAFPGDRPTHCHATAGKRIVLNLLFQRDACAATVSMLRSGDELISPLPDESLLIFALSGGIALHGATSCWEFEDGDAGVVGPGCAPESITISGAGTLYRAAVTQPRNEQAR